MAVRRLYEPLCIAFGTTVSSPTVPTYQLYDLPHKFTPRLYMESEDPNLVLREIGVWAGWEQAGSANRDNSQDFETTARPSHRHCSGPCRRSREFDRGLYARSCPLCEIPLVGNYRCDNCSGGRVARMWA